MTHASVFSLSGIYRITLLLALMLAMTAGPVLADPGPWQKGRLSLEVPRKARFEFGGVLGQRLEANLHQWLLTTPAANPGMLEMFRVRDRQPVPELVPWAGEFVGKYLLSAVQAQRMLRSDALDRTVREVIDQLIATQADDGYLGPFRKSERLLGQWDLWGHEHIMLALMMYAGDAGYEPAMAACKRAADLICSTYLDGSRRVFDAGSHEMNMAVIHAMGKIYRATGNERYLQMARHIEQDWERAGDYLRTGVAGVPFHLTPRPRWESLHDLQGLTELYLITGQNQYMQALANHWASIARHDRHNSGSFSTGEGAVGNPYQKGAIETCCTTAWVVLTADYLQLTGDSTAADELEWSTYNAVLGSQHPTGRWWTYDTPMDGARCASAHTIVFQARAGTPELNCCSVNGPRGLSMLSEWAVLVDASGPIVNHYGPCRITLPLADQTELTLVQETVYPAAGTIRLSVHVGRSAKFDMRLRIPGWSKRTTVAVNHHPIESVRPGAYLSIDRLWQDGDTIELTLDMRLRHWMGDCEQRGRASLYYGPLLLAFDQHYNKLDVAQFPTLDLERLPQSLEASSVTESGAFKPLVLFDVHSADGSTVRLCDFASAGAYGNGYISWLPVKNGRPVSDWLKYAFEFPDPGTVAEYPDGVVAQATLDGNGEPVTGVLESTVQVRPAMDRHGRAGGAVEFNGKDSKLQYTIPSFPAQFTVSAWVYINEFSPRMYQQVFCAWSGPSSDPLRISIMGDQVSARIEQESLYATAGVKVSTGRWFHVAAVRGGDQLQLYIDGQPQASVTTPVCPRTRPIQRFALGANPGPTHEENLNGRLDDFKFFAKALTHKDVLAIYEAAP